ncbi:MAG TPA: hypothetical protein VIB49_10775 [Thermoplasmata archaeon]
MVERATMPGDIEVREYHMIITTHRTIFAPISADVDVEEEALARNPRSIVIPHSALKRLKFKNEFLGCYFLIDYVREDGRRKKVEGVFQPLQRQVRQGRRTGRRWRDMVAEYARPVQSALQRTLSPDVVARSQWDL